MEALDVGACERWYELFLGETYHADVRGGEVTMDTTAMDRKGDKEIRQLMEQEAVSCLEGTELEGCRPSPVQAWNMLGEQSEHGKIEGTHIAAPTIGNGVAAARMRHFKVDGGVGEPSAKGLKSLNYAASKVVAYLQQEACDQGLIEDLFDEISVKPGILKSGKWSKERFLDGLRKAGISVTDSLPKRAFSVKPNEALGKRKPRGIISAGDEGVILGVFLIVPPLRGWCLPTHCLRPGASNTPMSTNMPQGLVTSSEVTTWTPQHRFWCIWRVVHEAHSWHRREHGIEETFRERSRRSGLGHWTAERGSAG